MIRRRMMPALAACVMMAGSAQAQATGSGGTASLIVTGAAVEDDVSLGITGAIGYRFNRTLGVSLELTALPSFDPELPQPVSSPIPYSILASGTGVVGSGSLGGVFFPAPIITFADQEAHATIFTGNLRLEIPTASRRFLPYVVGGAGVAHVQDEFTARTMYPPNILSGLPGSTIYIPSILPISTEIERSSLDMAVTLGGGIGLRASEHVTVDADLRYLAVLGARDLQVGRFGVGVSYRF